MLFFKLFLNIIITILTIEVTKGFLPINRSIIRAKKVGGGLEGCGNMNRPLLPDSVTSRPMTPVPSNDFNANIDYESSEDSKYSFKQILREETESPFRKVRVFVYASLLAAAGLGSFFSLTSIIKALIRAEDVTAALSNGAVNFLGIPVLAYLLQREFVARDKASSSLH